MTGPYEPRDGEPREPLPPYWSGPQPGQPPYAGQSQYPGHPGPAQYPVYPAPGQAQYPGQVQYPGQWPGYPGGGQPWPAPPRRRGMPGWAWALIAVGVLAAGLLVALVAVGGDSKSPKDAAGTDGRSLRAPAEVGDYAAVTSIDPHQLAEQFRGQLSQVGSGDVIDHAKIGVYGRTAQPRIVFIGFELGDVPQMKGQVADNGVESSVESFSAGIVKGVSRAGGSVTSSVHSVDPGPLGGFMRCGAISLSAQRVGICAWGDRSAMAMTMVVNPADDAEIARLTLQARAAAEH